MIDITAWMDGFLKALYRVYILPKISASGQTCGQRQKIGLFNLESREEQAQVYIAKKRAFARKQEKTKGKGDSFESPFPGLSDTT